MSNERELIRTLLEPYCTGGQLRGNCGALTSDIYDLINDPKVRREDALIAGLDIVLRQVVAPEYQNKIREKINSALTTARKEARAEAWRDAAQKLRDKADDWRSQPERWQRNAENAGMDIIREQDYADRDACLSKMAAAITLAIEFDEAAATTHKEGNE